ncbi:hypothetical protein [Cupriavidus sp. H39]|uniref:hypothetical protein n=1 Tax=Cupriavidus sp. H39 TaxID=3401635 RepID=UPI003D083D5F
MLETGKEMEEEGDKQEAPRGLALSVLADANGSWMRSSRRIGGAARARGAGGRRCATRDFTTPAPAPGSGKARPWGIGARARIRHAPRVYSRTPFQ